MGIIEQRPCWPCHHVGHIIEKSQGQGIILHLQLREHYPFKGGDHSITLNYN
jgi:hypothetical protein